MLLPQAATEAFQAVQQARYDAFTAAFEHVAARIDPIYKARPLPACPRASSLDAAAPAGLGGAGHRQARHCAGTPPSPVPRCLQSQLPHPTHPTPPLPRMQELTRSSVHPVGGQAYLSLDSSDEPFLHGIKFTAMPPTKRFRWGAPR